MMRSRVLVTGASKGIGKRIATLLAKDGHRLVLMSTHLESLEMVAQEVKRFGAECCHLVGDISEEQDAQRAVALAEEHFGGLDVLVNNAGVGVFKPVEEITVADWEKIMSVNARGTFLMSRSVLPLFKKQGRGHIVTILSDVARRTFPNGTLYCASKYAQEGFLLALRMELRPQGIRVSNIYPGITRTEFDGRPESSPDKAGFMDAEDVAKAVLFVMNAPPEVVVDEVMVHPLSQEY